MTKPMKIVALYNEKGGVGSTSLAAHLCCLARENGIRVAGISFDLTTELRGWIEPLGISWFDGLRHQEPDEGAELLVADIHGQARDIVLEPDLWVIPIEGRMSYENAIGLSDRLSGPILWLPNHIHGASFFFRYEIPPSLRRVEQHFPGVPRSHAIAEAGAERRLVWATDEGARSPGARYLRSALETVLERSGFALKAPAPRAPTQHPIADPAAAVRHAHAIAAALLDAELQSWPSPRMQGLAEEGLLDGMRDGADPGRDREIQRALADLADAMWDRAGVSPRARR